LRTIQKEVQYSAFLCLKHPDRHASGGEKAKEEVGRGWKRREREGKQGGMKNDGEGKRM